MKNIDELRYNKYIKYVGKKTIKFDDEVLNYIIDNCKTNKEIKNYLTALGIPLFILTNQRVDNLRRRFDYPAKGGRMAKIKFSDCEIEELLKCEMILKANESTITYIPFFMKEVGMANTLPDARQVFLKYNVPIDIIGDKRIENSYYRFKNKINLLGDKAFDKETRGRKSSYINSKSYKSLSYSEKNKILEKKLAESENTIEFLKKYTPSLPKQTATSKDYYKIIHQYNGNEVKINVAQISKDFNFSESGYYKYIHSLKSEKSNDDSRVLADIKYLMKKFKSKIGYRQITMKLEETYILYELKPVNHKRIQRLMRKNNIKCSVRKKNPYKGIWSATEQDKIAPNIIKRKFKNGKPGDKLLTDITYLYYNGKKAYLSAIKDCITGEIISHVVKDHMGIELSIDVLKKIDINKLNDEVIIHSDQGVHYTSYKFREEIKKLKIRQSMSRRGNCIDNAPMESFFGHFKDECDYEKAKDFKEVKRIIDEYMIYYNRQRRQWNKKKMTPIEYRNHLNCLYI